LTRLVRFLVRNWPLKLAAVVSATILYSGLVVSQNARVWPGPLQIQTVDQPQGAFLLEELPNVTVVRYLAPAEVAGRVSNADFRAEVDLSSVEPAPGGAPVRVAVTVRALNPRITVLSWEPQQVEVRLDPVTERTVQVTVDRGTVPPGLAASVPEVEPSSVVVRGASSLVARVRSVVARVTIDPNAIDVNSDVALFAADEFGEPVQPVDITPAEVHVFIHVLPAEGTRSVLVKPRFSGSVALGYAVTAIEVDPLAVMVSGRLEALTQLDSVQTEPIDLAGRRSDLDLEAALELPEGITAVDTSVVRVALTVEALESSRLYVVGLALDGARGDLQYRLSVPDVLVTIGGLTMELEALEPTALLGRLDVSGLGLGTHSVAVRVRPPTGLRVLEINPPNVAVTISAPPPGGVPPTASPASE
jgi:YbbR domain-containing protein